MAYLQTLIKKAQFFDDHIDQVKNSIQDQLNVVQNPDESTWTLFRVIWNFFCNFWGVQEPPSIYVNLPEIQVQNPTMENIMTAISLQLSITDASLYRDPCVSCFLVASPHLVLASIVIGFVILSFTIGKMMRIGVVTIVKIWILMGAVGWTCYLMTYPFLRALWAFVLSSPAYVIGVCFVMYGKECAEKFRACTPFAKNKAQSKIRKLQLSGSREKSSEIFTVYDTPQAVDSCTVV